MKRKIRWLSLLVIATLILGYVPMLPISVFAEGETNVNRDIPLRLVYDEETPFGQENSTSAAPGDIPNDASDGWERWSLPLGNGYFGASVFGRTATERIQLTEKTLCNGHNSSADSAGGLNNFSETYIDFGHPFTSVSDYERTLDLETALSTVGYTYGGVRYEREYFTSYIDNCMVIKLTASEDGALDFTLRPTIPYLQDFAYQSNKTTGKIYDTATKHGRVTSTVSNGVGTVHLSGHMGYYGIDFEGQYRVFTDGTVTAATEQITYKTNVSREGAGKDTFNSGVRDYTKQTLTVENGTLRVSGASEAYIVITLGTSYDQSAAEGNSSIYTTSVNENKLAVAGVDAREKNDARMESALAKSFAKDGVSLSMAYSLLRARHEKDYGELFSRVDFYLAVDEADLSRTTDELLTRYKNGVYSHYLEILYFQFGRYLMIASSRETTLPSNLQGTWNRYNYAPWGAGYWHNINEQMNYWPAFSTGLAECFEGYVNMQKAYMEQACRSTLSLLRSSPYNYMGSDGGFSIGTGVTPYTVSASSSAGNVGFTTQLFWEYYQYTMDEDILRETVYPILYEVAKFITKTVAYSESEDAYLTVYCDSPEQYVNGVWYHTEGTTYAQSFAYLNNRHLLDAAEILGLPDDELLTEVRRQIDKYDAILVGASGQIKEFREETYYGDLGEAQHRHISHLVGLYPGEMINGTTPVWLDAAKVTLTKRGDKATGWGVAHRLNLWARTKDGERAYDLYRQLLSANTATNLWDLHTPFQIDGNFGGTSGVTEMLMQSHEGYIDPFAATPASWADGAYRGLRARGGFTVDAEWQSGSLRSVAVTSTAGKTCTLHVQNIARATVRDSQGQRVAVTVIDKDTVSFETRVGERYTVEDIRERVTASPVMGLTVTPVGEDYAALSWQASEHATSYRISVAGMNDATYTLLTTSPVTAAVCAIPTEKNGEYLTFCVTAVDADGNESGRCVIPLVRTRPTVTDTEAVRLSNGTLQVLVRDTDADTYTLFEDGRAVVSSPYPVLLFSDYDENKAYTVTVKNVYGESDHAPIGEVTVLGEIGALEENTAVNVLAGTPATSILFENASGLSVHPNYPIANGFDGNLSTRWACGDRQNAPFSVTVTLDGRYSLKTLRIYDFRESSEKVSRSDKTVIEVYADGTWTTLHKNVALDRVTGQAYSEFDLAFATAEKLRLTFENSAAAKSATIYEVTCTAAYAAPADRSPLVKALTDTVLSDNTVPEVGYLTRLIEARANALTTLTDAYATDAAVERATAKLREAFASCTTAPDADLVGQPTVYNGEIAFSSLSTAGGLGGKRTADLAYRITGTQTASLTRESAKRTQPLVARFDLLLDAGASATVSLQGTGARMPSVKLSSEGVRLSGGVIVAIDGKPLHTPTDTAAVLLTEGRWYSLALLIAPTNGTQYLSFTIDGTVYTVKTDATVTAADGIQITKDGTAVALDRLSLDSGADATLNASRDLPVPVTPTGVTVSVADGVIFVNEGTAAEELKTALGYGARILTDAATGAEATALATGQTVVLHRDYRGEGCAYTYYTLSVIPSDHADHTSAGTWHADGTHHFKICSVCGERTGEDAHAFDGACDPHCSVCGYIREPGAHEFTDEYFITQDGHRRLCACGVAEEAASAHVSSGKADEGVAEVCTVCGYVITPALPIRVHEPKDDWRFDTNGHFHACTGCGEHTYDRAPHVMGEWKILNEATETRDGRLGRSCECGYTETRTYAYGEDVTPPESEPNPPVDEPSPNAPSGAQGGCRRGADPTLAFAMGAIAAAYAFYRRFFP